MKPSSKRPPSTPTPIQNEITPTLHEQIRRRAFELFEQRGREEGHELDDWLQAEEELTQQGTKMTAGRGSAAIAMSRASKL